MPGEEPEQPADAPIDLENQLILRLPAVPAASLRAAVAGGVNLKDRLTIQIEQDMRHGKVRFDGWSLPAKIVDLPTVIESHKTLDRKTFYKTADICQMMICREGIEEDRTEEKADEGKKKDGKDKKFLYPHGITPPLKNVRKKRFRKTLKKKFVDVPEIEKEVRRLFKQDSEAVHVRFEVVNADEDKGDGRPGTSGYSNPNLNNTNSHSMDIVEHDLFGDVVSSSDEDDTRAQDSDDGSRLSASSKFATTARDSFPSSTANEPRPYVTEFTKGMLGSQNQDNSMSSIPAYDMVESSSAAAAVAALEEASAASDQNNALLSKLADLEEEIRNLEHRREQQEEEIQNIENAALKQRFQSIINSLNEQVSEKRRQYDEIMMTLNG